jgi:hypothetical protein
VDALVARNRRHVSPAIREKWSRAWVPYADLSDEVKEADRVWARKVIALLSSKKFEEL